jgi:predicted RNA-binding protein
MEFRAGNLREAEQLLQNKWVREWHSYIGEKATSGSKQYLLLVPCAKAKPYLRPTKSFFYNWLWKFLEKRNLRDRVFVCSVSEPFALFPESDYDKMPDYELSPLLLKAEPKLLEDYCSTLARPIAGFLQRNSQNHERIIAYVRPDSTHALFLKRAMQLSGKFKIDFAVSSDDLKRIRKAHRRMWHLNWMIYLESRLGQATKLTANT